MALHLFQDVPREIQLKIIEFLASFNYHSLLFHQFWTSSPSFYLHQKRNLEDEHNIPIQLVLDYLVTFASCFIQSEGQELLQHLGSKNIHKLSLSISTKWKRHVEKHHHEYWEMYCGHICIHFQHDNTYVTINHSNFIEWYGRNYIDYELGWEANDGGYSDY